MSDYLFLFFLFLIQIPAKFFCFDAHRKSYNHWWEDRVTTRELILSIKQKYGDGEFLRTMHNTTTAMLMTNPHTEKFTLCILWQEGKPCLPHILPGKFYHCLQRQDFSQQLWDYFNISSSRAPSCIQITQRQPCTCLYMWRLFWEKNWYSQMRWGKIVAVYFSL